MKVNRIIVFCILVHMSLLGCNRRSPIAISAVDPGSYDSTWWNRAPVRLIQTNLREIDAEMDIDAYIQSIRDASANVVLLNVGGIVANYPTKLPYHYRNPFMAGDLVGTLVERLHSHGIKVIGRFDFSKLNEQLAEEKTDWLYVGTHGEHVNYNGQVHTCINGGYQQDYLFRILEEAITHYPLDGIFFNMIGYTTGDYDDNYHGICQCNNCKRRFQDSTGFSLPTVEDINDPVFRRYNEFRRVTSDDLFDRIGKFIKKLDNNLVINTYIDAGVDMIRMESSSHIRSQDEWNYFSTDHVKRVLGSYRDRAPSNLLQYFLAIGYRHVAAAPSISKNWVLQNMLNGAALDVYVIGTLTNQADRLFLSDVNELYGFHQANEKLFTNLESVSNIALIRGQGEEYKGMIKLLTEEHLSYDIIEAEAAAGDRLPRPLGSYQALILANVSLLNDSLAEKIDNYVHNGGKVLATGFTATRDGMGNPSISPRLRSLGINPQTEIYKRSKSTYLQISEQDKKALGSDAYNALDLLMMYGDFLRCTPRIGAETFFSLVPNTMFGPPEKCYFTNEEVSDTPGMVRYGYGKGQTVFIPWQIGSQYLLKGHHGHRVLFSDVMLNLLGVKRKIETDASPLLEISHMANRNKSFEWIGMINHAGQVGASFRDPVPMHHTLLRFKPQRVVREVRLLRSGEIIDFELDGDWLTCIVPRINDFEMAVCLYE